VIARRNYRVVDFKLEKSEEKWRCPKCGYEIPIKGLYIPSKTWLA